MKEQVRAAWRLVPTPARHAFWIRVNKLRHSAVDPELRLAARRTRGVASGPLVIAGVFRSGSGVGEAARGTYAALRNAGLDPIAVDLTEHYTPLDYEPGIPLGAMPSTKTGTLILHLNPPETTFALRKLGCLAKRGWRVIGYWAWELPQLPKSWDPGFKLVSEIWTLSEFTAEAIRARNAFALPNRTMKVSGLPLPVTPPHGHAPPSRNRSDIDRRFTVLTFADAKSSFDRKNPTAAIRAFRAAFGERTDCRLIVKTRNLEAAPDAAALINDAIGDAGNIELLDATLSEADKWALLESADVVVSLHRAEGFGLPLAEAMALGKATVATDWSGNLSFMDASCAVLAPSRMIPVTDRFGLYEEDGAMWAEPDEKAAAAALRKLRDDDAFRSGVEKAAAEKIRTICSLRHVGGAMRNLLDDPS